MLHASPFFQRRGRCDSDDDDAILGAEVLPLRREMALGDASSVSSSELPLREEQPAKRAPSRSSSPNPADANDDDDFEFEFLEERRRKETQQTASPQASSPQSSNSPADLLQSAPKRPSPAGRVNLASVVNDEPLAPVPVPTAVSFSSLSDDDEESSAEMEVVTEATEAVKTVVVVGTEGLYDEEEDSKPSMPHPSGAELKSEDAEASDGDQPLPRERRRSAWDEANVKVCTAVELSRDEIECLPRHAHLIRSGSRDDWALPFRDGAGRINRPLLLQARNVLCNADLCFNLRITKAVLAEAKRACETAWPGLPLPNFVRAEGGEDDEEPDEKPVKASTAALVQETKTMLERPLPPSVKVTDVSSSLLSKLQSRRQVLQTKPAVAPVQLTNQLPIRAQIRFSLEQQAKQALVAKLVQKTVIKKQVQAEYETKPAEVVAEAVEVKLAEVDEPVEAADSEDDDSDFKGDEEQEDQSGDEEYGSESESEQDAEDEEEDVVENQEQEACGDEAVAATKGDAATGVPGTSSEAPDSGDLVVGDEATTASPSASQEEADRNKAYRAVLLAEERAAKRQRGDGGLLENEASEESEEDEVGNYGDAFKQPEDREGDEDEAAIQINEDDLKGIVDSVSDDEDKADITELYRKQAEEKDAAELKRLQRDVENHTLMRRRRGDGTRLGRALDDPMSDEESDEEIELAREERFRAMMQERVAEAAAVGGGDGNDALREVEEEASQVQSFLSRARAARRSMQLQQQQQQQKQQMTQQQASTASTPVESLWGDILEETLLPLPGEDSRPALKRSATTLDAVAYLAAGDSSLGVGGGHASQRGTRMNRPTSSLSGVTQLGKAFVYTQVDDPEASSTKQGSTKTQSSSSNSVAAAAAAMTAAYKSRRVALSSAPTLSKRSLSLFQSSAPAAIKKALRAQTG